MCLPGQSCWENTSNGNDCNKGFTFTWFPCGCSPIKINSTDVIYTGSNLINSGILTNDNLTQALAKIDAIISSGGGFTLTDGNGTLAGATFVNWGGTLTSDVSISGYHDITLGNAPALRSFSAHATDFAVTTLLDLLLSGLGYIEIRNSGVGVYDESITLTSGGISLLYRNSISSKQTIVNVGDNLVKISSTDSSFPGATYDIDYSANFTSRSIPDKNYTDIHLAGLTFTNSPSNGNVPTFNGANWTYSTPSGGGITNTAAANELAKSDGTNLIPSTIFVNGGRLYGTSLHNNGGSLTGTVNQYIASGTYTPSISNTLNVSSSTPNGARWIRVGNVVNVSGTVSITPTTSAPTTTTFEVSLPITSTLSAGSNDLAGSAGNALSQGCYVRGGTTGALITYLATVTSATGISYTFTYLID